jgi:hypothetical protein
MGRCAVDVGIRESLPYIEARFLELKEAKSKGRLSWKSEVKESQLWRKVTV